MPINLYKPNLKTARKAPKRAARIKLQVKLYEGGMSFKEIADKFCMSENYVRKCINDSINKRNKNG